MGVKAHYESHLAKHYSWIFGGFEKMAADNMSFFESNGITPRANGVALDLGAGSGFQSVPLAKLGFHVTAVDFSAALISELRENGKGLPIDIIEGDMLDFDSFGAIAPELVVCMGDTLTHLESAERAGDLIRGAFRILLPGGRIALSLRDYTNELKGEDRFIPVRSDGERIFICFLEYCNDRVIVYDIVYERKESGWEQKVSSYPKIVLPPSAVEGMLVSAGFRIVNSSVERGMVSLIAARPE